MERPTVICLTPVRNEAWILDTFLQCASLWADHIIIADQNSTDGSKEIALLFPKVRLIENNSKSYNESERQALLIAEARKIPGKRLLVTLDADEVLTGDFMQTEQWKAILQSKPGSVFGFNWINLLPDLKNCWITDGYLPWAFMDDGTAHKGNEIHSPRVPVSDWSDIIPIDHIKVLHYQYVNWKRMQCKQVYYQCLERIKFPRKSAIEIFRAYHHMYAISSDNLLNCKNEWFSFYEQSGINIRKVSLNDENWFKAEIEQKIKEYGAPTFRKEDIWKGDFKEMDPRSVKDKLIHCWLNLTIKKEKTPVVAKLDRVLKKIY